MSYYFAIIGTKDNPLFEYEFGTSKQGGDGAAHFREEARHMNQFIVHSSLDLVDEIQWTTGAMYLKSIDRFYNNYISCFLTATGARFLLLHCPDPNATHNAHLNPLPHIPSSSSSITSGNLFASSGASIAEKRQSSSMSFGGLTSVGGGGGSSSGVNSVAYNPTSPAAEEAVRQFFADVYENWVKTVMNPFYVVNMPVTSSVFKARVAAAGRKYL